MIYIEVSIVTSFMTDCQYSRPLDQMPSPGEVIVALNKCPASRWDMEASMVTSLYSDERSIWKTLLSNVRAPRAARETMLRLGAIPLVWGKLHLVCGSPHLGSKGWGAGTGRSHDRQ